LEYARELVAVAPPLTPEQFHRLRALIVHADYADKTSHAAARGAA
jgi:hypothetical protein